VPTTNAAGTASSADTISAAEAWAAELQIRGYRLTAPRRAVLQALSECTASLSPAELLQHARQHYPQTGLVTVYRTLDVLTECGAVRRVHQPDGCHSYALASAGHAHHIICEKCRAVTEFEGCDLEALFKIVQRRTGYKVQAHWLELFGLCPACRAAG
jgi:Fur family transcriptional regulator, ferric uptake regulator